MRPTVHSLRSLVSRRPLVLVYHRITILPSDRWVLAVSPENFDSQLRFLCRFFQPVSLTALIDAVQRGEGNGCVAVTFDDGYADNFSTALPLLAKHGVPATFFITSDPVEQGREFWWDELERRVEATEYLDRWHALASLSVSDRDRLLGVPAAPRDAYRPITPDELRALSSSPLVEIGAHGKSHSNLTHLAADEVREEVVQGRAALERMTGRDVSLFSYPFGAFSDETDSIVRSAGFRAACTSISAALSPRKDVFHIPRCNVTDVSGLAFLRLVIGAMSRQDATKVARSV